MSSSLMALVLISFASPEAEAGLFFNYGQGTRVRTQRAQIKRNARKGHKREGWVTLQMKLRHPLSSVQREVFLLDRQGRPALDPRTKQRRRMDLAVFGPMGNLIRLYEITSHTADKRAQEAKTRRILKRYKKLYVKDRRTDRLVKLRRGLLLRTKIETLRVR